MSSLFLLIFCTFSSGNSMLTLYITYVVICIKFIKERDRAEEWYFSKIESQNFEFDKLNLYTHLLISPAMIQHSVFTVAALPLLFEQGNMIRSCAALTANISHSDES